MSAINETDDTILLDDLRLVRKIATGGMAEVWEARQVGIEGFEKRMAVKVVLPHLNDNEEFIKMFLDEGRLAAKLDHPNICQLYKLGSAQNVYYMAMEYIDGIALSDLLKAAAKKEISLEIQHCCQILIGACEGLDYAHSCTDRDGTPLNLVHRDISPQNIMITYNGAVKIVDFGIAKATSHINRTQAGVIKGKYAYMSPEQASGRPLDRRSDIFALGTVLWELTTGYRLFRSENDFATLNKIISGNYDPPSKYRENYPPELEAIVMKALSVNPEDRFNDCGEMQLALEDFLVSYNMAAGSKRLARYIQWVMAEDEEDDSDSTEVLTGGFDYSQHYPYEGTPQPQPYDSATQSHTPDPNENFNIAAKHDSPVALGQASSNEQSTSQAPLEVNVPLDAPATTYDMKGVSEELIYQLEEQAEEREEVSASLAEGDASLPENLLASTQELALPDHLDELIAMGEKRAEALSQIEEENEELESHSVEEFASSELEEDPEDEFAATLIGGKQALSSMIEKAIQVQAQPPSEQQENEENSFASSTDDINKRKTMALEVDEFIQNYEEKKTSTSSRQSLWVYLLLFLILLLGGGAGYYFYVWLPSMQQNIGDIESDNEAWWLIKTVPPRAKIFFNGRLKGETPKMISVTLGQGCLLRLSAEGYYDHFVRIPELTEKLVKKPLFVTLRKKELKKDFGKLLLDVWPKSTRVYLSGRLLPYSPLGVYKISHSAKYAFVLKLTAPKYRTIFHKVLLRPRETSRLSLKLKRDYCQLGVRQARRCGFVSIQIYGPTGTFIEIDGQIVGIGALRHYRLRQGRHSLRIFKAGFKTVEQTFQVKRLRTTRINIRLR